MPPITRAQAREIARSKEQTCIQNTVEKIKKHDEQNGDKTIGSRIEKIDQPSVNMKSNPVLKLVKAKKCSNFQGFSPIDAEMATLFTKSCRVTCEIEYIVQNKPFTLYDQSKLKKKLRSSVNLK